MINKIVKVYAGDNYNIIATFFNGVIKQYCVKNLFKEYPQLKALRDKELFNSIVVEPGGVAVSWNEELDLDAEEIWSNGIEIGHEDGLNPAYSLGYSITAIRKEKNTTQKELSQKTGIIQGDISKIERGIANPSLNTIDRLAKGLGVKFKIEFYE